MPTTTSITYASAIVLMLVQAYINLVPTCYLCSIPVLLVMCNITACEMLCFTSLALLGQNKYQFRSIL